MNKKQIEEIEFREKEKARYLLEKNRDKKKASIRDFFPELRLKGVYGYYMFGQPVWLLLPYFDVVIVNVLPYRNEAALNSKLGLNIETLIELQKKGRVQLLLDASPSEYVNLDDLDPLLETIPCSDYRINAYCNCLSQKSEDYYSSGERLFEGKLGEFAKEIHWRKFVKRPSYELEGNATACYAQLMALGYSDLISELSQLANRSPTMAYRALYVYARFLSDPTFYSLDGVNPIDKEQAKVKQYFDESLKWKSTSQTKILPIPIDVGKALIRRLPLDMPYDLEKALEIPTGKARKALSELDKVVTNNAKDKIMDRKMALEIALMETNESIRSIDERIATIKKIMNAASITIGVTGAISGFAIGEPLLSSIAAAAGIAVKTTGHVASRIPEALAKLHKPSHVVVFYDMVRSAKK